MQQPAKHVIFSSRRSMCSDVQEEIDYWCVNENYELPVYLFANKCDLLREVQDSFLAGAKMERMCRDAVCSGRANVYSTLLLRRKSSMAHGCAIHPRVSFSHFDACTPSR